MFSKRGCGCSELDGKALFADCRVLKRGHEFSASKWMASYHKVLCAGRRQLAGRRYISAALTQICTRPWFKVRYNSCLRQEHNAKGCRYK